MNKLCPYCFYLNELDVHNCARCDNLLLDIPGCAQCGATKLVFAQYCYHCGFQFLPAYPIYGHDVGSQKNPLYPASTNGQAKKSEGIDASDFLATQFQQESLQLLHVQTGLLIALPAIISPILIGKASKGCRPHIDVQDFPNSAVVSRRQASLHLLKKECAIADLDSTNGTYVNDIPLLVGHQHPLQFGDRIDFGQSEQFTFLFIRELPIHLKHLQAVSGGDAEFEQEILHTYDQRAQHSLEQMQTAIAQQDSALLASAADGLTIASHNVGARVVHLLAAQLQAAIPTHPADYHHQLLKVIEDALQKVRFFTKVYY